MGLLVLVAILAVGTLGSGVWFLPYFIGMYVGTSVGTHLIVRGSAWAYLLMPLPALLCRFPPQRVRDIVRKLEEREVERV